MNARTTVRVLTLALIGTVVTFTTEPQQTKKSTAPEQTRFGLEELEVIS